MKLLLFVQQRYYARLWDQDHLRPLAATTLNRLSYKLGSLIRYNPHLKPIHLRRFDQDQRKIIQGLLLVPFLFLGFCLPQSLHCARPGFGIFEGCHNAIVEFPLVGPTSFSKFGYLPKSRFYREGIAVVLGMRRRWDDRCATKKAVLFSCTIEPPKDLDCGAGEDLRYFRRPNVGCRK